MIEENRVYVFSYINMLSLEITFGLSNCHLRLAGIEIKAIHRLMFTIRNFLKHTNISYLSELEQET